MTEAAKPPDGGVVDGAEDSEKDCSPDGPIQWTDSFWPTSNRSADASSVEVPFEEQLKILDEDEFVEKFENGSRLLVSGVRYASESVLLKCQTRRSPRDAFVFNEHSFRVRIRPSFLARYELALVAMGSVHRIGFLVGFDDGGPGKEKYFMFLLTRPYHGQWYVRLPYRAIVGPVKFVKTPKMLDSQTKEIRENFYVRQADDQENVMFGLVAAIEFESKMVVVERANFGHRNPARYEAWAPEKVVVVPDWEGLRIWHAQSRSADTNREQCMAIFKPYPNVTCRPVPGYVHVWGVREGARQQATGSEMLHPRTATASSGSLKRQSSIMSSKLSLKSVANFTQFVKLVKSGSSDKDKILSLFDRFLTGLEMENLDATTMQSIQQDLERICDQKDDPLMLVARFNQWTACNVSPAKSPKFQSGPAQAAEADNAMYTIDDVNAILHGSKTLSVCPVTATKPGDVVATPEDRRGDRFLVLSVHDLGRGPTCLLQDLLEDKKFVLPTTAVNRKKTIHSQCVTPIAGGTGYAGDAVEYLDTEQSNEAKLGTLLIGGQQSSIVSFPHTNDISDVHTVSSESLLIPDTCRHNFWQPCDAIHRVGTRPIVPTSSQLQ